MSKGGWDRLSNVNRPDTSSATEVEDIAHIPRGSMHRGTEELSTSDREDLVHNVESVSFLLYNDNMSALLI
jgi:hypothetical protein